MFLYRKKSVRFSYQTSRIWGYIYEIRFVIVVKKNDKEAREDKYMCIYMYLIKISIPTKLWAYDSYSFHNFGKYSKRYETGRFKLYLLLLNSDEQIFLLSYAKGLKRKHLTSQIMP